MEVRALVLLALPFFRLSSEFFLGLSDHYPSIFNRFFGQPSSKCVSDFLIVQLFQLIRWYETHQRNFCIVLSIHTIESNIVSFLFFFLGAFLTYHLSFEA